MIDPQAITPTSLPSVPLTDRKDLPAIPGIYFAIDSLGNVQYIGRSVNIQQRWAGHERKKQIQCLHKPRIAYLQVDELSLLPKIEKALIEYFNPPLNRHKRHYPDRERMTIDIEGLRDEIESAKDDPLWQELSLSKKVRILLQQQLGQIKKEKGEGDDD